MGKQTLNHQVPECHSVQKMPMIASFPLKPGAGLLIPMPPGMYFVTNNKRVLTGGDCGSTKLFAF